MTDPHDATPADSATTRPEADVSDALTARWAWLADQHTPPAPAGQVGSLANRVLVYTVPTFTPVVLPHLDRNRSGLILADWSPKKGRDPVNDTGFEGPVLLDPAAYQHYTATPDAPFWLPDNQLEAPSLEEILDQQLLAGATAALTPTGYIRAGDTESLAAGARIVKRLARQDVIFVVPLDISLVDRTYIRQVTAILADAECPIGLILDRQFDSPDRVPGRVVPNLRQLAVSVPLMPLRTDFNAVDLVAHGAFAGAIGTASRLRHTADPAQQQWPGNYRDHSPSVLFTELLSWQRGSEIASLYGSRSEVARRCYCAVCEGQRLTRFVRQSQRNEAMAHAIAVWSPYVADMLDRPTMRDRARYWRTLCEGTVREYDIISDQLQLWGESRLRPRDALARWATLPAWPVQAPARRP